MLIKNETKCIIALLLIGCFVTNAQTIRGETEYYSPTSTQWLLDAVGETGGKAVKSIFLVYCRKSQQKGTGFGLRKGPIITNAHVVMECDPADLYVISSANVPILISDLIIDAKRDLAALVPKEELSEGLILSGNDYLKPGLMVHSWGYPLGYNIPPPLLTVGYLSGLRLYKSNDTSSAVSHLVVNAAFNSGNSGGPLLLSSDGKVIGVVVAKARPLFTPLVEEVLKRFDAIDFGVMIGGATVGGKDTSFSEAQLVAYIARSLRDMGQLMIGEAITTLEVHAFLKENGLTVPRE